MTDDPHQALAAKDARIAELTAQRDEAWRNNLTLRQQIDQLKDEVEDAEARIEQARAAIRDIQAKGIPAAEADRLDRVFTALNITGTHTEEP